jgi:hypothetical protein
MSLLDVVEEADPELDEYLEGALCRRPNDVPPGPPTRWLLAGNDDEPVVVVPFGRKDAEEKEEEEVEKGG